jgi:hypothetical protein
MIRFACILALALSVSAVSAQSVKLSDAEISILLSGNTAVGDWDGTSYRQYFGTDGVTILVQPNARPSLGEWRVADDEFQSIGPGERDWKGWFVMEYNGVWFWVSKTTPPTPFEVLEGNQLIVE